jgi:(R,R)-butanediol dehydrogenase / meso-butanediol dehydrogenase / diacetyl reductase
VRAVRWHGRRDVRLDEVPAARPPGPDEVRIRVEWTGICGTDREEWLSGPHWIPVGAPHPLSRRQAPLTLGHEVCGRVIDVGRHVRGLAEGQLVAVDGLFSCGSCWWCLRHEVTLCPDIADIGLHLDGGLTESMTLPAATCLPLPGGVTAEEGAFAEPLAVAVRALRKGRLAEAESVLVIGAGMVGVATMVAARSMGARFVSVAAPSEVRRRTAQGLGADAVLDAAAPDLDEQVRQLHDGRGPDVVVEAAGTSQAAERATTLARKGGRIVIVGLPNEPGRLDYFSIVAGEREVIGSLSHVWDEDFATAVRVLGERSLNPALVVAARIALEDTVEIGFAAMTRRDLPGVKVLVSPWLAPSGAPAIDTQQGAA